MRRSWIILILSALVGCGGGEKVVSVPPLSEEESWEIVGEWAYVRQEVADEENGFLVLREALEQAGEDERYDESVWAVAEKALAHDVWEVSHEDLKSLRAFSYLSPFKALVKQGVEEGTELLESGKTQEGAYRLLTCWLVADRFLQASSSAVHTFSGIATEGIAIKGVSSALKQGLLGRDELDLLIERAPVRPGMDKSGGKGLRGELSYYLLPQIAGMSVEETLFMTGPYDWMDDLPVVRLIAGHPAPYDRAETLREATRQYGEIIRWLESEDFEGGQPGVRLRSAYSDLVETVGFGEGQLEFGATEENIELYERVFPEEGLGLESDAVLRKMRKEVRGLDNPVGRLASVRFLPVSAAIKESVLRLMAEGRVLFAGLVAARTGGDPFAEARFDRGIWIDPFTGEFLKVDLERRVVWSVGPDGVDGGGAELVRGEGREWKGDIVGSWKIRE